MIARAPVFSLRWPLSRRHAGRGTHPGDPVKSFLTLSSSALLVACATGATGALPADAEGGCGAGSGPDVADEVFNLAIDDAWTDHSVYVAGQDDYDVHATVTNHGPDTANFRVLYTMISDVEPTLGETEGSFMGGETYTLPAGETVDVTATSESLPVQESTLCHWEAETVLISWQQRDTDVDDNKAPTATFEVVSE